MQNQVTLALSAYAFTSYAMNVITGLKVHFTKYYHSYLQKGIDNDPVPGCNPKCSWFNFLYSICAYMRVQVL